jgi:hypothetical protein
MTINTNAIIPYALVFLGIIAAALAIYSLKTGRTYAGYRDIGRKDQPIAFMAQVYFLIFLAAGSFVLAVLAFLRVVN